MNPNPLQALVDAGACVDEHTFDQLVVYMAMAKGRSRVLGPPKSHLTSLHLETAVRIGESDKDLRGLGEGWSRG